eukprot:gene5284-5519_t
MLDFYQWLRDDKRQKEEVLNYLQAENHYAEQYFSALEPLIQQLEQEMDASHPDVEYWDAYVVEVSPDGSRIAVGSDTVGNECYSLQVYQEQVVGWQPGCYMSHLEWAVSYDGTAVPVTLAFRRDLLKGDGSNMAVLHGYGAYGSSKWPSFDPADLALLNRGLVIAWAHVRGGGELGSAWHTGGQKFTKKNTFYDFLAVAHYLVKRCYTSHNKLAVWGRSAGGLTLGACLNMEPSFAAVAILDVPFLDVLFTMRDPDLLLTIKERSEWGDPLSDKYGSAAAKVVVCPDVMMMQLGHLRVPCHTSQSSVLLMVSAAAVAAWCW